jgi:filamentous hemagglutinin family protein
MSPTRNAPLTGRNRLLATCAAAVVATMTTGMPIRAQVLAPGGFQGSHVVVNDTADVLQSGTNTLVTIKQPRAIINWTPGANFTANGEYDFLPTGRSADFVNASNRSGQDYIVLNRIIAADQSRAIALNGIVRSTLGTFASTTNGGQVWFYSPSGILLGATAQINVGSLLLTANNIADDDFLDGNNRFSFGRDNSNATVQIATGAQISAISRDSYVAIVAPRIVQAGNVRVNGSAAYVAAEQVDMTISGSLFDIAVAVGSSAATPGGSTINHSGQTTVTNNIPENGYGSGATTPRDVMMVAVPKNDAVTLLVSGGGIAYEQATTANVVGGKIILSGGSNITANAVSDAALGSGRADVVINSGSFGVAAGSNQQAMDVLASATGRATVDASNIAAQARFGGNVSLHGDRGAAVRATGASSTVDIAGNLTVDASGTEDGARQSASVVVSGSGGALLVGGGVTVRANSSGAANFVSTRTAEIVHSAGGTIEVGSSTQVQADASADTRVGRDAISAMAGTAQIVSSGTGTTRLGASTVATARGTGINGGAGTGGTVAITSSAGGLNTGSLTVSTEGVGGIGAGSGPTETGYGPAMGGGAGRGGLARIELAGSNNLGEVTVITRATGGAGGISQQGPDPAGAGGAGGEAVAGNAILSFGAGTTISSLEVQATARGGNGGESGYGNGGAGGAATGGNISLALPGSPAPTSVSINTNAIGGTGGQGGTTQGANNTYELVLGSFTWEEALAAAAARTNDSGVRGHLATITTPQEQARVRVVLGENLAWLGASDSGDEGGFTWRAGPEAGDALAFTAFNPGEPNNAGDEDFIDINNQGGWNDSNSFRRLSYLVEYEGSA